MTDNFASSAMKSTGPSMSLVDSNMNAGSMGIGNYKGVMLCNRPFGGSTAANKPGASPGKQTFTAGVVPSAIGQNVPIANKEQFTLKRVKKDNVLTKHKKWLADLQRTKDRLETQYLEEMHRKEESHKKFQEHEQKMRQMVTQVMREDKATAKETHENTSASTGADHKQYSSSSNQAKDEDKASGKSYPETVSVTAEAKSVSTSSGGSAKQSKPAWAFASEKEVENLLEEKEQSEVDELINFAQSLDFDKYIGDMEVQTMMERLKKRITDLEKDVAMEESREAESDERRAKREMLEALGIAEASLALNTENGSSAESKAMQAAKELLAGEEDLQAIHSAKSVAAMLESAKNKVNLPVVKSTEDARIVNQPVVVTHEPSEGSRLDPVAKNTVSNLPYMHRSPSV